VAVSTELLIDLHVTEFTPRVVLNGALFATSGGDSCRKCKRRRKTTTWILNGFLSTAIRHVVTRRLDSFKSRRSVAQSGIISRLWPAIHRTGRGAFEAAARWCSRVSGVGGVFRDSPFGIICQHPQFYFLCQSQHLLRWFRYIWHKC
jgi:hypothetical protein